MWAGQHTDQLGTGTGNLYLSATGGAIPGGTRQRPSIIFSRMTNF